MIGALRRFIQNLFKPNERKHRDKRQTPPPSTDQRLLEIESFCTNVALTGIGVILLFAVYWGFLNDAPAPTFVEKASLFLKNAAGAVTLSLIAALAASLIGLTLGFLFGIPKSIQKIKRNNAAEAARAAPPVSQTPAPATAEALRQPPVQTAPQVGYENNQSIEELSSTLTTMLLGASLTQFSSFCDAIYRMSLFLSYELVGAGSNIKVHNQDIYSIHSYTTGLPSPYFLFLIISFFVIGIFFGYIETRTRLTMLFTSSDIDIRRAYDPPLPQANTKGELPEQLRLISEVTTPASPKAAMQVDIRPVEPSEEDLRRASEPLPEATSDKLLWAVSKARTGGYRVADYVLSQILPLVDNANTVAQVLSDVRILAGNASGAVDAAVKALDTSKADANTEGLFTTLKATLLNSLYQNNQYEAGIQASDTLIAHNKADDWDYLRRACAFGQKYSSLVTTPDTLEDEKAAAKAEALKALQEVIRMQPDPAAASRRTLSELLNAKETDVNSDLYPLNTLPEFQALLTE